MKIIKEEIILETVQYGSLTCNFCKSSSTRYIASKNFWKQKLSPSCTIEDENFTFSFFAHHFWFYIIRVYITCAGQYCEENIIYCNFFITANISLFNRHSIQIQ